MKVKILYNAAGEYTIIRIGRVNVVKFYAFGYELLHAATFGVASTPNQRSVVGDMRVMSQALYEGRREGFKVLNRELWAQLKARVNVVQGVSNIAINGIKALRETKGEEITSLAARKYVKALVDLRPPVGKANHGAKSFANVRRLSRNKGFDIMLPRMSKKVKDNPSLANDIQINYENKAEIYKRAKQSLETTLWSVYVPPVSHSQNGKLPSLKIKMPDGQRGGLAVKSFSIKGSALCLIDFDRIIPFGIELGDQVAQSTVKVYVGA